MDIAASGIVSSSSPVDEGQLLKIKSGEAPVDFERGYYQLRIAGASQLLLVARQSYREGSVAALIPPEPSIPPGVQVELLARQRVAGLIQGPIDHAFLAGDQGCAIQIANFCDLPGDFAENRYEIEVERLQGALRAPVVKQSLQHTFSDSELLTVVLGANYRPEQFPPGSWVVFFRR